MIEMQPDLLVSIISIAISLIALVLGGLNYYQRFLDNRVLLSVESIAAIGILSIGKKQIREWIDKAYELEEENAIVDDDDLEMLRERDPRKASPAFRIINKSRFAITIEEVGFSIGESIVPRRMFAVNDPVRHGVKLPIRLQSREACVFISNQNLSNWAIRGSATHAYARTACETVVYADAQDILEYFEMIDSFAEEC